MLRRRDLAAAIAAAAGGVAVAAVWRPGSSRAEARVVRIVAKKFAFSPHEIILKNGEPVVFELISGDRKHGFEVPALGLKGEFDPAGVNRIPFTPTRAGRFGFTCNIFCGDGHDDMEGDIVVVER